MAERYIYQEEPHDSESEEIHHNCAIVGAYSNGSSSNGETLSRSVLNGLVALNHRGQEGAGILLANEDAFAIEKDNGLAEIVFTAKRSLPKLLNASVCLGQDRYSTSGTDFDTQPFVDQGIACAHNGNLTNISWLREEYNLPSVIDGVESDTRAALAVINRMPGSERDRILEGIKRLEGAYSMVFATTGEDPSLFASRDPLGFRPLSLGRFKDGSGFTVASEDVAFGPMNSEFVRDILPGETVMINGDGVTTIAMDNREALAQCIFELIYISRPDSTIFGTSVYEFRSREGEILGRHLPEGAEVVMPVPRSGIAAAQGVANSEGFRERIRSFTEDKGILYQDGIYTNPYININKGSRTFIQPNQRQEAARSKYSVNQAIVEGKSVVIVDDSIVRGSIAEVVKKLREAGAREVHALIASPELKHACYMGVDFGKGELIANKIPDIDDRATSLGLDSLYHMSYSEIIEAAIGNKVEESVAGDIFRRNDFCGACFTGEYPLDITGVIPRTNKNEK